MLKAELEGDIITIVTDDRLAENAALADAINDAAPHLLESFEATGMEDGELRWKVERDEWPSLVEVLDALLASGEGHDYTEVEEAIEIVERARG